MFVPVWGFRFLPQFGILGFQTFRYKFSKYGGIISSLQSMSRRKLENSQKISRSAITAHFSAVREYLSRPSLMKRRKDH